MGAAEFNGTGANTSLSSATAQPQLVGGGVFTVVAAIRPDSLGQSNLGVIFATATGALAGRASFGLQSGGGGVGLRFTVARTLTQTLFITNNRPLATTAGKQLAVVAAIYDDSQTPKVRLFSTAVASGDNDGPIIEHTYGTSQNGTGSASGSDSTWVIGNAPTVNATFDGLIGWVVAVPASLSQNQLEALANGVNPVAVVGGIANAKVIVFINGSSLNLLDPAATWTDTALTFNDAAPMVGGEWFAPAAGEVGSQAFAQTVSPTGVASAAGAGSPTVTTTTTVTPTAIAGVSVAGSPTVSPGDTVVSPTGVGSVAATGSPTLTTGVVTISPTGVASTSAAGSPTVTVNSTVAPTGVSSTSSPGSPTITTTYTVAAGGVPSTATVGAPTVTAAGSTISPTGIGTTAAAGSPTVAPAVWAISVAGRATSAAVGTHVVSATNTITADSVGATSAVGAPAVAIFSIIRPAGIASTAAAGVVHVVVGQALNVSDGAVELVAANRRRSVSIADSGLRRVALADDGRNRLTLDGDGRVVVAPVNF